MSEKLTLEELRKRVKAYGDAHACCGPGFCGGLWQMLYEELSRELEIALAASEKAHADFRAEVDAKSKELATERDKWKWEYENVSKFATQYEAERDTLAQKLREAEAWGEKAREALGKTGLLDLLAATQNERNSLAQKLREAQAWGGMALVALVAMRDVSPCQFTDDSPLMKVAQAIATSPASALSSLKAEVRREAFEEEAAEKGLPRNPGQAGTEKSNG